MTETAVPIKQEKKLLAAVMAARFELEPQQFLATVTRTCFPSGQATNEQLIAFLAVSNEHNLNPFTREIYAFPNKAGGIQPIVGIDGWMKLINNHPQFDGLEFTDHLTGEDAKVYAVTCKIYRKDRQHPTEVTEYMEECYRPTEPWNKMPRRMLRHKAVMQCARYAFGFAGIQDEDEARDAINAEIGPALATAAATETKTEALKEKIGRRKGEKIIDAETSPASSDAPAAPSSQEAGSVSQPITGVSSSRKDESQAAQAGAPAPDNGKQEPLFSEPVPPQEKPKPPVIEDRIITREEQLGLVEILTAKKATRSLVLNKLKEYRYERTQDIKLKDLPLFLNWAQSLPEPKSA